MSRNLLARYIWLADTIRRYGAITRSRIDELWALSPFSEGEGMSRRTFYNYRNAIEELFKINIEYNPTTFEYFIKEEDSRQSGITDWMLNSAAISNVMTDVTDVADRVFLEDVPSARMFLAPVVSALREKHPIKFTYRPYTRVNPTPGVVIEPYFLKIFRQRWYVTGMNIVDERIKTYALDRMEDLAIDRDRTFTEPEDFNAEKYVNDSFGIVFDQSKPYEVSLRATTRQAKYLRALPLHHSQRETLHNDFSIFHYRLRLTPDFVQELLSLGEEVKVLEPRELVAMLRARLSAALAQYEGK